MFSCIGENAKGVFCNSRGPETGPRGTAAHPPERIWNELKLVNRCLGAVFIILVEANAGLDTEMLCADHLPKKR